MLRRLTTALLLLSLALWLLSNFLSISCVLPDHDAGEQHKIRAEESAELPLGAQSPADGTYTVMIRYDKYYGLDILVRV